jgi:hypothetical protein
MELIFILYKRYDYVALNDSIDTAATNTSKSTQRQHILVH